MRPSPNHRPPRPILVSASAVDPTGAGPGQRPAQRPQGRSPELFQGLHTRKGNFTGLGPLPGLALSSTPPPAPAPAVGTGLCSRCVPA